MLKFQPRHSFDCRVCYEPQLKWQYHVEWVSNPPQGFRLKLFPNSFEEKFEDDPRDLPVDSKSNSLLDRVQLLDRIPDILTPGQ